MLTTVCSVSLLHLLLTHYASSTRNTQICMHRHFCWAEKWNTNFSL